MMTVCVVANLLLCCFVLFCFVFGCATTVWVPTVKNLAAKFLCCSIGIAGCNNDKKIACWCSISERQSWHRYHHMMQL